MPTLGIYSCHDNLDHVGSVAWKTCSKSYWKQTLVSHWSRSRVTSGTSNVVAWRISTVFLQKFGKNMSKHNRRCHGFKLQKLQMWAVSAVSSNVFQHVALSLGKRENSKKCTLDSAKFRFWGTVMIWKTAGSVRKTNNKLFLPLPGSLFFDPFLKIWLSGDQTLRPPALKPAVLCLFLPLLYRAKKGLSTFSAFSLWQGEYDTSFRSPLTSAGSSSSGSLRLVSRCHCGQCKLQTVFNDTKGLKPIRCYCSKCRHFHASSFAVYLPADVDWTGAKVILQCCFKQTCFAGTKPWLVIWIYGAWNIKLSIHHFTGFLWRYRSPNKFLTRKRHPSASRFLRCCGASRKAHLWPLLHQAWCSKSGRKQPVEKHSGLKKW